jgi:hypothetical protein
VNSTHGRLTVQSLSLGVAVLAILAVLGKCEEEVVHIDKRWNMTNLWCVSKEQLLHEPLPAALLDNSALDVNDILWKARVAAGQRHATRRIVTEWLTLSRGSNMKSYYVIQILAFPGDGSDTCLALRDWEVVLPSGRLAVRNGANKVVESAAGGREKLEVRGDEVVLMRSADAHSSTNYNIEYLVRKAYADGIGKTRIDEGAHVPLGCMEAIRIALSCVGQGDKITRYWTVTGGPVLESRGGVWFYTVPVVHESSDGDRKTETVLVLLDKTTVRGRRREGGAGEEASGSRRQ